MSYQEKCFSSTKKSVCSTKHGILYITERGILYIPGAPTFCRTRSVKQAGSWQPAPAAFQREAKSETMQRNKRGDGNAF